MRKQTLAIILALLMILLPAACGSKDEPPASPAPTNSDSPAPTQSESPSPSVPPVRIESPAGKYYVSSMQSGDIDFIEFMMSMNEFADDGDVFDPKNVFIELREDGTFILSMSSNDEDRAEGTYVINGKSITFTSESEEVSGTIDGNLIIVEQEDGGEVSRMVYDKSGPLVYTPPERNYDRSDDYGYESPYTDGEPFEGGYTIVEVGEFNIVSDWFPFEDPLVVDGYFDNGIVAAGDVYYTLTDGALKQYRRDGVELVFEKNLIADDEYRHICADNEGVLYASGFMCEFAAYRDGERIFIHDGPDTVAMHPLGEWGISYFVGSNVEKVLVGDGDLGSEDWRFEETDTISSITIGNDHIFVAGRSVANDEQAIFVYDLNGNLKLTLGDKGYSEPDGLGSVTAVVETVNGFVALDGNMRHICFWRKDGTFIDAIDCGDLLKGTDYPWLSSASLTSDGDILVGLSCERPDDSARELIAYRLSGF